MELWNEVQGCKSQGLEMRVNERYVEITWSSRRGKTSLIFELQEVQESEARLYTSAKAGRS